MKMNQHISADDMKKSFDRSARKMVFKYSSPPFPIPTKIYVLSLGLPAVPAVHMEDQENLELPPKSQRELDLLVHRQGHKKRWHTPQSCRITPLKASEYGAPLQKPARQQVSISARMPATVIGNKGIFFSRRVT